MKTQTNNSELRIAAQWDANAWMRFGELNSGNDSTYTDVLCPVLFKLLNKNVVGRQVLDAGCGLGFFSNYIARRGFRVSGIDISSRCVAIARSSFPAINFVKANVVDFAERKKGQFDACVANMLLHNVPNIEEVAIAISAALNSEGVLVGCIPHPEFWFNRRRPASTRLKICGKTAYLTPFKIHGADSHPSPFTYFDRKEEHYWRTLRKAGFTKIEAISIEENSAVPRDIIFFVANKGRRQKYAANE